jgi:DNA (cytosine-5)-methyltransferase 1
MRAAYYNDNEPSAAGWLDNLIRAGLLPQGKVDRRDIREIRGDEIRRLHHVHLFAGIGGWPHALTLAGWPDDRPIWTGSCPCQPYSVAGKRRGREDERNLWPEFRRLIRECNPSTVIGEQVTSPDGREWFSGVRADLETMGYVVGASDLPACCVGAPHPRQRLYWVAYSAKQRIEQGNQIPGRCPSGISQVGEWSGPHDHCHPGRLANTFGSRLEVMREQQARPERATVERGGLAGFWSSHDIIRHKCDSRRIEPGTEPVAPRLPEHVGLIRGYGNAIVPQVAAIFIRAFLEAEAEIHQSNRGVHE